MSGTPPLVTEVVLTRMRPSPVADTTAFERNGTLTFESMTPLWPSVPSSLNHTRSLTEVGLVAAHAAGHHLVQRVEVERDLAGVHIDRIRPLVIEERRRTPHRDEVPLQTGDVQRDVVRHVQVDIAHVDRDGFLARFRHSACAHEPGNTEGTGRACRKLLQIARHVVVG